MIIDVVPSVVDATRSRWLPHVDPNVVDPDTLPGALTGLTTPSELLAAVAERRETVDRAEADLLVLAVEWAHAHPWLPGGGGKPVEWRAPRWGLDRDGGLTDGAPDERDLGFDYEESLDFGLPTLAWNAPAAFAAAYQRPTTWGQSLIRDALTLRHRLPKLWAEVQAGRCGSWPARKVAQAVLGKAADVAAYVDDIAAARAGRIGPIVLERILDEAMLALYPEQREAEQAEARQRTFVELDRRVDEFGITDLIVRGDWTDLVDFDAAVSEIAAALAVVVNADPDAAHGPYADLIASPAQVRRARAVGILAHPEDALALLAAAQEIVEARPAPRRPRLPVRKERKEIVLHLNLSDAAVVGLAPGCSDRAGRVVFTDLVREWCGRPEAVVTVKTILQAGEDRYAESVAYHDPPEWMRDLVVHRDPTCVFPHCSRPALDCDLDHIEEWRSGGGGGPTCAANLAPLCRHHHRLKTHAGWRYEALAPAVYLWTDPHQRHYLRARDGTISLHPPRPPAPACV